MANNYQFGCQQCSTHTFLCNCSGERTLSDSLVHPLVFGMASNLLYKHAMNPATVCMCMCVFSPDALRAVSISATLTVQKVSVNLRPTE